MPQIFGPQKGKIKNPPYDKLMKPLEMLMDKQTRTKAKGNKPYELEFETMVRALVFYHLQDHTSGRHLLQVLEEDEFARNHIAPPQGIKRSTFFEAVNSRGLEQMLYLFQELQAQAAHILPREHAQLGDLVLIDGSLIDATLSMTWADFTKDVKKAKIHMGFNINQSIPTKIFFTEGKANEHPFVDQILEPGQTGVMDRNYICYQDFDRWQIQGQHYVCRIRANCRKTVIKENEIDPEGMVFYDAIVLLGNPSVNQTKQEHRVVGYQVEDKEYWVATDRLDLTGEQIALAYKLRWEIENFFGWWKRHLRVYHILARSKYGFMVQMLAGLITYLLLAIYCWEQHQEKVSIKRVRELRIKIQNEAQALNVAKKRKPKNRKRKNRGRRYAKT
jgi:hypothetical protein